MTLCQHDELYLERKRHDEEHWELVTWEDVHSELWWYYQPTSILRDILENGETIKTDAAKYRKAGETAVAGG